MILNIKSEIANLRQEIKKDISSLREETKADINSICSEQSTLRAAHNELSKEQSDLGKALNDNMIRVEAFDETQDSLAKEYKKLQEKCMDLETRQNLRLVGIEEGAEAGQPTKFAAAFFPEVLGENNFDAPVIIDRAHKMLPKKPKRGERPRAIIVRLHYYSDKEKILNLSKGKGRLTYRGALVHIFPDVSPEVGRLRAAFSPVKAKLRDAKIEYSLYYPAKLTVTLNGIRYSFDTPKAAEEFYIKRIVSVEQQEG